MTASVLETPSGARAALSRSRRLGRLAGSTLACPRPAHAQHLKLAPFPRPAGRTVRGGAGSCSHYDGGKCGQGRPGQSAAFAAMTLPWLPWRRGTHCT